MKDYLIPAIIAVVLAVISTVLTVGFLSQHNATAPIIGATSGPDHYNLEQFFGGLLKGTQIATSSMGTSITVTANEFKGWSAAGVVSFTPGLVAASTVTLPASSTLSAIIPHAGDTQAFCIRNATTTANTQLILAGGTGTNILVASSSVSALGSKTILPGKVGCVTLVREALTSSSFDIDAVLTTYQ